MNTMTIATSSREQAGLWVAKAVTGLLIFSLLMLHLVVNHLVAAGGLATYAAVVAYLSNPLILTMELVFLILVVTHALLGVRGIVLDLRPSAAGMRVVDWTLSLLGLAAIGYGVWLAVTVAAAG